MRTISTYRWHHSLVADHIHATLAVKLILANTVLLVAFLAGVVVDALLLCRLALLVPNLYLIEPDFALRARIPLLCPDRDALRAVPVVAPIKDCDILIFAALFRHFPANGALITLGSGSCSLLNLLLTSGIASLLL